MGFFNSLKGKADVGTDNNSSRSEPTPPYPESSQHDGWSTAQEKKHVFGGGPAPELNAGTTSRVRQSEDFAASPGPPPSHRQKRADETFAPPPGPPPSRKLTTPENPPPYHDWTVIPDTALLPPPPPLPQDCSPANNASADSADRAHEWCDRHPVYTPSQPTLELHLLANAGHVTLDKPSAQLTARGFALRHTAPTTWTVRTGKAQQDAILVSSIPLYFATVDSPLLTGRTKTVYFEIRIAAILDANSGIAIGFAAKPYPTWRLPGWHRASIGVHGDDGRRFVNDPWGGRDFVDAFRPGETIGIGMTFETEELRTPGPEGRVKTRAFVTRNGQTDKKWTWEIDEERDKREGGVEGLLGEGDLYAAIGVFGGLDFAVDFGTACAYMAND